MPLSENRNMTWCVDSGRRERKSQNMSQSCNTDSSSSPVTCHTPAIVPLLNLQNFYFRKYQDVFYKLITCELGLICYEQCPTHAIQFSDIRYAQLKPVCCTAVAVQAAQCGIWINKRAGRHSYSRVHLPGWVARPDNIIAQFEDGITGGESIQTGPEGHWQSLILDFETRNDTFTANCYCKHLECSVSTSGTNIMINLLIASICSLTMPIPTWPTDLGSKQMSCCQKC
jgi:hypothetical protein